MLFLLAGPVAGTAPADGVTAEVGFSGWVTPDAWIPLRIEITSEGGLDGLVDVDVPAGLPATAAVVYRRPVRVPAGARRRLTIPIVVADPRRPLTVTVRDSRGGVVAQRKVALSHGQVVEGIVLALTADPAGLEFLSGYSRRIRGAYLHEEDLPDHWAAYGGVDLVVLRDVDERSVSGAQREALREWIAQGGRLLVTGDRLLQQRQAWLADLLPAVVSGATALTPAEPLPGMPGPLPVAVLQPKPGAAVVPARGMPLIVSRAYGRGLVTAWAFDAFAPALRAWPGRLPLWDGVLLGRPARPVARSDLADVIPTTRSLPGSAQAQIIALAILYILAIRFALRHFAGRPWAWGALALVIVSFAVVLYVVSSAARRSAATAVQLSVLESTGAQNLARVTTYVAVVLPYGGSYALTLPDGSLVRPLAPAAVLSTAGNTVGGDAAPGVLMFEAVQMAPFPVQGRATAGADGLDLVIENRSGLSIAAPAVYLNGQTQMLAEIAEHAVTTLLPGRWARADVNAATGDFERDARAWIAARLDAYTAPAIIGYKTLWLMGALRDARFSAQLRGAREQRGLVLLLGAIDVVGGR